MKVIGIAGPTNLYPYQKYFKDKLLPKGLGGTVLPALIEKLIHKGYKVVLFTLDKGMFKPFSLESECIRIWVAPCRLRHRARDFFNVERQFLTRIMDLDKEVDVIHAHWTYEFAMAALCSNKPVLVTAHDAPLSILRYDLTPYRFIRTLMAYWVSYKTHNLTAVSEYVANHFIKFMGYKGNIYVIPNGMNPLPDTREKCSQINRPLIFAGVIGGWNKMRNSKTLIKAFNELLKLYPQSELWLFGPDHGRYEKAEQWATYQNLAEKIRFYGYIQNDQLLELLSRYVDVFVHPSLEESFGMTILEAMFLGLPIIAGKNSGGVTYTLGKGECGLLVDVKQKDELLEAMLTLAKSPELRKELGAKAYHYAKENFDIDKVTDLYLNTYKLTISENTFL